MNRLIERYRRALQEVRDYLAKYMDGNGDPPWQNMLNDWLRTLDDELRRDVVNMQFVAAHAASTVKATVGMGSLSDLNLYPENGLILRPGADAAAINRQYHVLVNELFSAATAVARM